MKQKSNDLSNDQFNISWEIYYGWLGEINSDLPPPPCPPTVNKFNKNITAKRNSYGQTYKIINRAGKSSRVKSNPRRTRLVVEETNDSKTLVAGTQVRYTWTKARVHKDVVIDGREELHGEDV
ncbi:hypothetical protein RUM43_004192 [Polyplax serrata]|uniref:Uncharacterized protein n=1 Tax=Polyplax serrata TaxID=468196 RepID=A0AAN8SAM3_POLSC